MADQRVLITGAAGIVGTIMRSRLRRPGRVLRLLDVTDQPAAARRIGSCFETVQETCKNVS
jgi:nucleoside-diphosphate-sugar epimerase